MTETATATLVLATAQELEVDVVAKVVDSDTINGMSSGDTIEYKIDVGNSGTTTLSDFVVTLSLLDEQLKRWACFLRTHQGYGACTLWFTLEPMVVATAIKSSE